MIQLEQPLPISGLPLDLRTLAADIHADNIKAGWWKQDVVPEMGRQPRTCRTLHRNVGELLALVHSEISEADHGHLHGLMDDKLPHRVMIEVELADTAIRVLDMLGFYAEDWDGGVVSGPIPLPERDFWPDWCLMMHRLTTQALEGFRKGNAPKGCASLDTLLGVIHFAAITFKLDLTGAIAEKRAFNATRADHKPENRAKVGGKAF